MELLELSGPVRVAGDHVLVIGHSKTSLKRGLDYAEALVLRSRDGELHAAKVIDIVFEIEDTVYMLEVGSRLPEDLAQERLTGLDPAIHDLPLHEVVDLLGALARGEDELPQRQASTA